MGQVPQENQGDLADCLIERLINTAMTQDASSSAAREQILDAAEALFARQGFDPTTIKEIGAAARLNPALLYYYFGNKEELYKAVLQRLITGLAFRGTQVLETAAAPADAIRALVATQVEFLLGHSNLPRLFVREMIDHDARHAEAVILQLAAGLFQRLCDVIERGQREGVFRADVEPRYAAVSTISQVVYFMIARPAIAIFLQLGPSGVSDETARAFGRHAGDFAVHALSPVEKPA
ncbi:MAG TPA: TetR/AcrR family transcriptional regulator [Gemmatimonadales bacterium]|nr:TetR/AcrR family transcriptional regulator [Gemmatimonadales bacterium]